MRNLIYYMSHIIDDRIIKRYNKLKNELPKNYDIIWLCQEHINKSKLIENNIEYFEFDNNLVKPKNVCGFNPGKPIEYIYENNFF